jgi:hypothetical protein
MASARLATSTRANCSASTRKRVGRVSTTAATRIECYAHGPASASGGHVLGACPQKPQSGRAGVPADFRSVAGSVAGRAYLLTSVPPSRKCPDLTFPRRNSFAGDTLGRSRSGILGLIREPDQSAAGTSSLYQEILSHPAGKEFVFPPGKLFPPDTGRPLWAVVLKVHSDSERRGRESPSSYCPAFQNCVRDRFSTRVETTLEIVGTREVGQPIDRRQRVARVLVEGIVLSCDQFPGRMARRTQRALLSKSINLRAAVSANSGSFMC